MERPINLNYLREITDGNVELEAELFRVFIASATQCISELRAAMVANDEGAWSKQAHALRGISANLGAQPLTQICVWAQEDHHASAEEKKKIIEKIENEFSRVRTVIG